MKILCFRNDFNGNAIRQVDDKYGGVGYYRIVKPAQYIKGHEVEVIGADISKKGKTRDKKWDTIFREYDVLWTPYFSDGEEASAIFYHRDKHNKKVIIDLDDDYLDISPTHRLYDRFKETKKDKAFLSAILTFADAITVSTEPLKQRIDEHLRKVYNQKKNIFVVPNMNDASLWQQVEKRNDGKIVIGYAGSNSHYDDLKMCFPSIARIMDKYKNVHFEIMGTVSTKEAVDLFGVFSKEARDRCDLIPATATFLEYPEHLVKQKWSIGIAPLVDTAFTRCKSHIKWLEYSMSGIPVIASKVHPYYVPLLGKEIIVNDKTGLLLRPNEWFSALEDLILHEQKRNSLVKNAQEHILKNWQYDEVFTDAVNKVIKSIE